MICIMDDAPFCVVKGDGGDPRGGGDDDGYMLLLLVLDVRG